MENDNFESNGFDTAILLIVFNRLNSTKKVFEAIKYIRPKRLYIASDGPRKHVEEDKIKVKETREYLLANIDWPCKVNTSFREENLGCGKNVKLSIDWFFENEDYGIILEDDCVPVNSFFEYCEELLKKYLDDERIGMISGSNHFTNYYSIKDSYLFSKYYSCWGWATWKRAWQHMDFEMKWLNSDSKNAIIRNIGYGKVTYLHWKNNLSKVQNDVVDAWDFQWCFSLAAQNQLCIFPQENLISNIGFGKEATHTNGKAKKSYNIVRSIDFPLKHPKYVLVNKKFDAIYERKTLRTRLLLDLFPQTLKNSIKRTLFRK